MADDIHEHSTTWQVQVGYGFMGERVNSTTSAKFQRQSGKFHAWYFMISSLPRGDSGDQSHTDESINQSIVPLYSHVGVVNYTDGE